MFFIDDKRGDTFPMFKLDLFVVMISTGNKYKVENVSFEDKIVYIRDGDSFRWIDFDAVDFETVVIQ